MDQSSSVPADVAGAGRADAITPAGSRLGSRLGIGEFCLLIIAGALSALAVMHVELSLGIPGHAILYLVLPMSLGLCLAPTRFSGFLMSLGGVGTLAAYYVGGAVVGPGDLARIAALGPLLDLAASASARGRTSYVYFAAAAVTTNLLAFATKAVLASLGMDTGGHGFLLRWPTSLPSYIACAVVTGVVIAACRVRFSRSE